MALDLRPERYGSKALAKGAEKTGKEILSNVKPVTVSQTVQTPGTKPGGRVAVNDWVSRYNRVMNGVSQYDQKRNGGFTRDASGGYMGNINALIADYENIRDVADQLGFQDSQKYLDQLKQLQGSIQGINDNFSQFEDEDAYNRYMEYWQDQEEKRNLDLDAYSREIAQLEQQLEDYDPQIDWTNPTERKQYDAGLKELEDEINRRKQYLAQAQRIQKKDDFSAVANPESEKYDAAFDSKSGYVSTEQDGKLQRMMSQYSMGYDDLTYEYINNQNGIRDTIKQKAGAYKKGETPFEAKGYDYMTEDEVGLYNYYYSMGGKASAEAYLDTIQEDLNQRKAAGMYQQMEGKTGAELVFGVEAGLDQFKGGIKGAVRAVKGDDSYVAPSATQYASGMVREDLADDGFKLPSWLGGASLGQVGYDAITTTANMAPSIAVGMLNPTMGAAAMGVSAGGSAYQEALNEGYSVDQARGYGILSGASEIVMEKVLGGISAYGGNTLGKFFTQNMKNADTALKRIAKELGGSMLSEFSEEYLQEVLTPVFQNLTLGTDNEVKLVSAEALYAGFLGAITGGIMEGPSVIAGNATPAPSNATAVGEKSTPGGVTQQPTAVGDKMSATEAVAKNATTTVGVSKMETVQLTPDIESFSAQFGKQAEYVRRNFLEGQDLDLREDQDVALREYEIGFQAAFMIGKAGKKEALTSENVPYLSQSQREIAYQMGMEAAAEQNAAVSKVEGSEIETAAVPGGINRAVQISTGKPVEIAKISNVDGNGGMTFRLSDGRTVEASDIQYGTESESVLYESVADLGASAEVSNKLVNTWRENPGGVSAETYAAGMMEAFNYGRYNIPETEMEQSETIQPLTATQRSTAYQLGKTHGSELVQTKEANIRRAGALAKAQKASRMAAQQTFTATSADNSRVTSTSVGKVHFDRQGRTLSAVQETGLKTMEQLSQLFGTEFHVFESYEKDGKRVFRDENGQEQAAPNGWYDPETGHIHIDLNAGSGGRGTMMFTVAHEMTHFIRDWSPAKFDKLAEAVFQLVYQEQDINVIALVREQQAKAARTGRKMSFDEAYEEVVADSMESILTSGRVVELMAEVKQQDQSLWKKIRKWFQDLAEDIRKLIKAYDGYKPDSTEGRAVAAMEEMLPIIEGFYMDALQDASENYRAAEGQKNTTHKGDKKYSYAGENARTADLDQLATAKAMQQEGVSTETIRQQTGWFMGTDGKWRFEIDDSNMRVDQHGDARGAVSYKWALEDMESAREELWGHADMETLNNVRAYNRAILSGDTAEENRLHDLLINGPHAHNFSLYAEAREHVKEMSQKFGGVLHSGSQLADYVQHDALYEAYPQLQAASFRFGWLPDGTRGQYNPDDNSIIISNEIADSPERTIIHEIQHAIQNAEGFASGSSPEYWETRQRSGDSIGVNDQKIDAQMKHAQEILDSLPEDVAAEFRDWYDLNQRNENAGMVRAQELSSGQYGEQFNDYFMTTWTLEDLAKYNYSRGINDLYRNTAGEIEARDTANRWQAGLDAEGRKNTPPDLGDDKTVFTEGNVRSEQAIGRTADNKPFVIVERDILAGVDQSQWVKTVTNNIRNRFPNGVTIGRNSIAINQRSRRELTYSEYMHKIKKEDPQLYSDKLRATDNLDEIIEATTNWISEGLKHERTDNIRDFARGNVLIRIGNNDYSAEVVVGTKTNGTMLLYDILNLQKTNISHKKTDASLTSESRNDSTDRQLASHEEAPLITGTHDVGETGGATSVTNINRKDNGVKAKESEGGNKYSQRDPLQEKALKALQKENAQLKEDVSRLRELVKLQGKVTNGTRFKRSSMEAAAMYLKKLFHTGGDTKELVDKLKNFYEYMASESLLTLETVQEHAAPIIEWLKENEKFQRSQYAQEVLDTLKGQSFYLDEAQQQEAISQYGNLANYRRAVKNRANSKAGQSLDQLWQELSSHYPDIFPPDTSASDMPLMFADALDMLENMEDTETSADLMMKDQTMLEELLDSFWRVDRLTTVADRYEKKINELRWKHEQQMKQLRSDRNSALAELREDKKAAVATVRDNRDRAAIRGKIRKTMRKLDMLLKSETKEKHVPDSMKKAVADALSLMNDIDIGTVEKRISSLQHEIRNLKRKLEQAEGLGDRELTEEFRAQLDEKELALQRYEKSGGRLTALRDAYADIRNSDDPDIVAGYDAEVAGALAELADSIKDTSFQDMSREQLQDVLDMYTMVLTRIRDANKQFGARRGETLQENAAETEADIHKFGISEKDPGIVADKLGKLVRGFSWNNLRPVDAFHRLGSRKLEQLYMDLVDGMAQRGRQIKEIGQFITDIRKKTGYKSFDLKEAETYTTVDGKEMKLTLAEKMSIYAYSKRDQAYDHMAEGGFTYAKDLTYKEKGKTKVHTGKAKTWRLSMEDLQTICGSLTENQRQYVDAVQQFLTEFGTHGDKVNMELYGIKLFNKENAYFPLQSDRDYRKSVENQLGGTMTAASLKSDGMTKKTVPGANNPIVLEDFDRVVFRHLDKMANYANLVLPLENLRRVFDYQTSASENQAPASMKALIGATFGREAQQYVEQFLTDANGTRMSMGVQNPLEIMFTRNKGMAVAANLSVMIQQISAVVRAVAEISPKHLMWATENQKGIKLYDEMVKYAPIAIIKDMGGFDTGSNRSIEDYIGFEEAPNSAKKVWNNMQKLFGMGAETMDKVGWCLIWNGVKREVASRQQYEVNSEKFLQECGKRFTEVIVKTQVYDSVLSRSGYMRDKHGTMRYLTSFMGEPTVQAGMVFNSHLDVVRAIQQKKDVRLNVKRLIRTDAALISALVVNGMLKAIPYAMRDDDEDEGYWERWAKQFGSALSELWKPWELLPILRNIDDLASGRTIEQPDMALLSDLLQVGTKVIHVMQDEEAMADMKPDDWYALAKELAGSVGNLLGVPVKNIWRDAEGYVRIWKDATDGIDSDGMLLDAMWRGLKGEEKTKHEGIYDAMVSGDTARLDALKATYKTDGSYESAVRKALRLHDPRIKEMANARYEGDYDRLEALSYEIEAEGIFDMATIRAAYEAERTAQAKERGITLEEDSAAEQAEESTVFSMDEYYAAIRSGSKNSIQTAHNALIEEKKQEYYLEREAENSIASSVTSKVKGEYLDEDISRVDAKSILTKYGGKSKAEAETEIKKWEFQMEYHYAWGSRDRCYRSGTITRSQLVSAVMDIEDASREEAQEYVDFLELEMQNEKVDITASEASSYFEHAKPHGISVEVYLDYKARTKGIQNDKDANGNFIRYSAVKKIMTVIDSLPLTGSQKLALAESNGWADSTIQEYKTW